MENSFEDFLEEEIPVLKGHKGICRYLLLKKVRMIFPEYDAVYMIRYCDFYYKGNGVKKYLSIYYKEKLVTKYNVYYNCTLGRIGKGLSIPHPCSIVIGSGVSIGENCTIYQNVTIGAKRSGCAVQNEYPVIGNDCTFYAGAVVIGNIKISDGTQVGANAVLTESTEKDGIYVGVPAKRIKK